MKNSIRLKPAQSLFSRASWADFHEAKVRDRADLVWQKGPQNRMQLGLYGLDSREVVDLTSCQTMSSELNSWLQEFRGQAPAINKGSVRLRVAPDGRRGVWLDFANQDVKNLFEEKNYLKWLSEHAFVEIGQRRKHLIWKDGQPKLTDPELHPWFETYGPDGREIPLYGVVGGFSQPGFRANRKLVEVVTELAARTSLRSWLELFCGNGNFLLSLAARGYDVEGVEMDALALAGLERSLQPEWVARVKFERADVHRKGQPLPLFEGRGLLVDPPRSGLRETLHALEGGARPPAIVYVSCFMENLTHDAAALKRLGYRITALVGVDQFPFTPHAEWVALFQI